MESLLSHAVSHPDSIALIHNDSRISYSKLDEEVTRVSEALLNVEFGKGDRLLVHMDKSIATIVVILAILKIEAVYIPIPVSMSSDSVSEIASSADSVGIVSETEGVQDIYRGSHCSLLNCYGHLLKLAKQPQVAKASGKPSLDGQEALATILFTSGSSGRPKGVKISAKAIESFTDWASEYFAITNKDVFLGHASLNFDISLFDIFVSLNNGASVVLLDVSIQNNARVIADQVEKNKVSIWQSVPSVLGLLAAADIAHVDQKMKSVRIVFFSGEQMPKPTLDFLFEGYSSAKYYNCYGCTETNDTFIYPFDKDNFSYPLPIGETLSYVDYLLIDPETGEQSVQNFGELYVSCPTMMTGYSLPTEETGGVFFTKNEGASVKQFYRTGDLVSRDENGQFRFVSRADAVVKIKGYRVNTSDIQNEILTIDNVVNVTVFPVLNNTIGTELVALVQIMDGTTLNSVNLRVKLSRALKKESIPKHIQISTNKLPQTRNGKVDRKSLALKWEKEINQLSETKKVIESAY